MTSALRPQRLLLLPLLFLRLLLVLLLTQSPTQIVRKLHRYLLALWNLWAIASISLSTRLPDTRFQPNANFREGMLN